MNRPAATVIGTNVVVDFGDHDTNVPRVLPTVAGDGCDAQDLLDCGGPRSAPAR